MKGQGTTMVAPSHSVRVGSDGAPVSGRGPVRRAVPRMAGPDGIGWRRLWSETWRILAALSFGLFVLIAVVTAKDTRHYLPGDPWPYVDAAIGVAVTVLLPFRRRYPRVVAGITIAASAISMTAIGPAVVAVVSLTTRRRWKEVACAALGAFAAGVLLRVFHPYVDPTVAQRYGDVFSNVFFTGLCVMIGLFIGARRELVATLQAQVANAGREQQLRVAQARVGERARIAREMHDVLAHRISLVAMHAGALNYRTDLTPGEVREAAGVIQANSHLALTELRDVLGVLRDPSLEGAAPEPPQPTLARLHELVASATAAGQRVQLTMEPDLATESIADTLSRNVFRIVQELLTNGRKYAPTKVVTVNVDRVRQGIQVLARNNLPATAPGLLPASGMGLIGLAERAELSGGALSFGTNRGGQFEVIAWLPLDRASGTASGTASDKE